MKHRIYAVVLLVVFLACTFMFGIIMESVGYVGAEHEDETELPDALEGMVFENMGRKTLYSACGEYDVSLDELLVELGLPMDIDSQTQLRDLPFEEDPGDIVKEAIIRMKQE